MIFSLAQQGHLLSYLFIVSPPFQCRDNHIRVKVVIRRSDGNHHPTVFYCLIVQFDDIRQIVLFHVHCSPQIFIKTGAFIAVAKPFNPLFFKVVVGETNGYIFRVRCFQFVSDNFVTADEYRVPLCAQMLCYLYIVFVPVIGAFVIDEEIARLKVDTACIGI